MSPFASASAARRTAVVADRRSYARLSLGPATIAKPASIATINAAHTERLRNHGVLFSPHFKSPPCGDALLMVEIGLCYSWLCRENDWPLPKRAAVPCVKLWCRPDVWRRAGFPTRRRRWGVGGFALPPPQREEKELEGSSSGLQVVCCTAPAQTMAWKSPQR